MLRARPDPPSFDDVYARLLIAGEAHLVSSRKTPYRVVAGESKGRRVILARPRSGTIYVHEDCFGVDLTCQGTRAGGIYNGPVSIWDWYARD